MADKDFKRKLTAILSADVAGYSRLMRDDEAATLKILEDYKQVMFSLINQHRGRVIDSPGDKHPGRGCERGRCGAMCCGGPERVQGEECRAP
jgi:class 3 adenylate cyclase